MQYQDQEQYRRGTCAFVGYSARAREYWNTQAMAVNPVKSSLNKFGKCPGCEAGMNAESDYVIVVCGDNSFAPILRCIGCYEVMIMTSGSKKK